MCGSSKIIMTHVFYLYTRLKICIIELDELEIQFLLFLTDTLTNIAQTKI
jgi:hypothetical protein